MIMSAASKLGAHSHQIRFKQASEGRVHAFSALSGPNASVVVNGCQGPPLSDDFLGDDIEDVFIKLKSD